MKAGTNILGRLRRWKTGAGQHVVGLFTVAYLSAGVAPCLAMTHPVAAEPAAATAHEAHAAHEHRDFDTPRHEGHAAHGGTPAAHEHATEPDAHEPTAPADNAERCPHCPAGAGGAVIPHDADHSSCSALEDLTNVTPSQAKDAPQPPAPPLGAAAFTLPPPLASPVAPAPSHAVRTPPVPLNIRHCVFLI